MVDDPITPAGAVSIPPPPPADAQAPASSAQLASAAQAVEDLVPLALTVTHDLGVKTPAMPDLTKAQIAAFVGNVVAVVVAFNVHITSGQQASILALTGSLGVALVLADAAIRFGRSLLVGKQVQAKAIQKP